MSEVVNWKKVKLFGERTCIVCENKIEKDAWALANFDRHPYTFKHLGCVETANDDEIEAFQEQVYAMLADLQSDMRLLSARVQSIYEATFPAEKPPKVI